MEEIKVYLDPEQQKEIQKNIEFEKVIAGEESIRKIYVVNAIKYNLNIELELVGEFVEISKTIKNLKPEQVKEIEFKFNPKITIMKPITAQLKIKLDYVIR